MFRSSKTRETLSKTRETLSKPTFIDFYAGGGGSSAGFEKAGFECLAAIEINEHACKTLAANSMPVLRADARTLSLDDLRSFMKKQRSTRDSACARRRNGEVDIVIGSPPCQSISVAGRTPNQPVDSDTLYEHPIRFAEALGAKVVMIENVPHMRTKIGARGTTLLEDVEALMDECGFDVSHAILNAKDYGVPQSRKRLFVVGTLKTRVGKFEFPEPLVSEAQTYRDVLLDDAEVQKDVEDWNYDVYMSEAKQVYYRERKERLPGYVRFVDSNNMDNIPNTLRAGYMKSRGADALVCRDETMKSMRMLTIRECMRIQTFPESHVFKGTVSAVYEQIGNAVPVNLAYHVAMSIKACLAGSAKAVKTVKTVKTVKVAKVAKAETSMRCTRSMRSMRSAKATKATKATRSDAEEEEEEEEEERPRKIARKSEWQEDRLYEVEAILDHRIVRKGTFPAFMDFLIKWKGYGPEANS